MAATYTVKQVAQILGYSTNSIYTFLKEKRIKGVRVGKGRFRIPQAELDRLLGARQGKTLAPVQVSSVSTVPPTQAPTIVIEEDATHLRLLDSIQIVLPDIFDWFVGVAALITGIAMFLFNQAFTGGPARAAAPVIWGLQMMLICAGLGLLASTTLWHTPRWWTVVFRLSLVAISVVFTIILVWLGNLDGAITYGTIGLVVGLTLAIPLSGVTSMMLLLSSLLVALVAVVAFAPSMPVVSEFVKFVPVGGSAVPLVFAFGVGIFLWLFWVAYRKYRTLFMVFSWIVIGVYVGIAVWYVHFGYWPQAFLFVVLAFGADLLSLWKSVHTFRTKREQAILHGMLWSMVFLLSVAVVIIYLLQKNAMVFTKQEMQGKVTFAQTQIGEVITKIQDTLTTTAKNADFAAALVKKDTKQLTVVAKVIYQSNANVRRVVLLDGQGDGLLLYPYGIFDQPNFAFRDYFIRARDSGRSVVSDAFEALADKSGRRVVVIATPVYGAKKEFIGVITGSIDLDALGARLQNLTSDNRGEYITVIDTKGQRVIHPDPKLTGLAIGADDPIRKGLTGASGIELGTDKDGLQAFITYAPLVPFGWAIGIKAPLSGIVRIADQGTKFIFILLIVTMVVEGMFVFLLFSRSPEGAGRGGGP